MVLICSSGGFDRERKSNIHIYAQGAFKYVNLPLPHSGIRRNSPSHVWCRRCQRRRSRKHKKDIVDTAVSAGSFNTLVATVKAAGLVKTLKGKGPFTVFAPTDAAFAKLPAGTLESLLKPENKSKLAAILTCHVLPGKVMASDIAGKSLKVATVQGSKVSVDAMKGVKMTTQCGQGRRGRLRRCYPCHRHGDHAPDHVIRRSDDGGLAIGAAPVFL